MLGGAVTEKILFRRELAALVAAYLAAGGVIHTCAIAGDGAHADMRPSWFKRGQARAALKATTIVQRSKQSAAHVTLPLARSIEIRTRFIGGEPALSIAKDLEISVKRVNGVLDAAGLRAKVAA